MHLMDSSVRATLIAGELRAMRTGDAPMLVATKEIELDGLIVGALYFQESGHGWLFWPLAEGFDHERYLRSVAAYRKEYPSPLAANPSDPYAVEVAKRNAQLVERYGQ